MEIQYRENCLSPQDFIRLRIAVGRVAIPLPQAEAALRTGLFRVTAFCEGKAVGMGRLVGDGAMYWYIQDMAVLPEYQGRGIEKAARSSPEPSPDTGRRLQSGDRPCIVICRHEANAVF